MKIIAMYLPQFHQVKENDEWWGEGFTEWTTVTAAEKLFPQHVQPRRPLHDNYYNLLDKKTMLWQSDLMHRYSVDGICFYHYYFKDGRKILEKPVENLLKWKDINMPYCFSWANESWVRSWSKVSENEGNTWSEKFDGSRTDVENDTGVLLEQDYGGIKEWKEHYRYLSSFFHDSRYIKFNGKPVFLIYKPANIDCLKEMLQCWNEMAREEGFPGVHTIGTNIVDYQIYGLSSANLQEPQDTIEKFFPQKFNNADYVMRSLDYQEVWGRLIDKDVVPGISLGAFVGYDDTPRRGHGGSVIRYSSPYAFYSGMKRLFLKAERNDSPFVFINAWNEWGEGMYLEPDVLHEFKYLEALKQAREDVYREGEKTNVNNLLTDNSFLEGEIKSLRYTIDRYRGYWQVFNKWMEQIEKSIPVTYFFKKNKYKSIAVYGYGMLGKHFIFQLEKCGWKVEYVIDRHKEKKTDGIVLYTLEEAIPEVDVIVVTVLYDFNNIHDVLSKKINGDVIAISSVFQ